LNSSLNTQYYCRKLKANMVADWVSRAVRQLNNCGLGSWAPPPSRSFCIMTLLMLQSMNALHVRKVKWRNYKGIKKQNYLLFKQQYGSVTVVPLPSTVLSWTTCSMVYNMILGTGWVYPTERFFIHHTKQCEILIPAQL
jgi:hypothetical protein